MFHNVLNIKKIISDPKLYQYIAVGGISAGVDISLFLYLNRVLSYHYLLIATFSFIIATLVNYFLCTLFVFKDSSKFSSHQQLMLIYLVSGVGLLIHHSLLWILYESLTLPIALCKLFAMGVAFGWNFLSRKHLVFRL